MSDTIKIGDEVRTKVGKVTRILHNGYVNVNLNNASDLYVYEGNLELVRKHNQPEAAVTTDKWAGVKRVKPIAAEEVYDLLLVIDDRWMVIRLGPGTPFVVRSDVMQPYAQPVEVGSRVRRTAGPENTGEVLILRRKEAVYDDGNELWIAPLDELAVIE